MNAQIAKIISAITAPPLIMVAAICVFIFFSDKFGQLGYGLIFLGLGGFFPFVLFIIDYFLNKTDTFNPDRKTRENIFLVGAFSYGFLIVFFSTAWINSPFWANLSMLMCLLLLALLAVDHLFDKASVHAAMFTFWVLILVVGMGDKWALAFLTLPFIIWSRLTMKEHTWPQILWGLVIGMLLGIFSWVLI